MNAQPFALAVEGKKGPKKNKKNMLALLYDEPTIFEVPEALSASHYVGSPSIYGAANDDDGSSAAAMLEGVNVWSFAEQEAAKDVGYRFMM